jgi:hypothetical protein
MDGSLINFSALSGLLISLLKEIWPFLLGGGTAVLALWYLKKMTATPGSNFSHWYPYVIQAVLAVEKMVPDDTSNKYLSKADLFLKEFERIYVSQTGQPVDAALKEWANRMKEIVVLQLKTQLTKPVAPVTPPVA